MKQCYTCKVFKPITEFYKRNNSVYGYCKKCDYRRKVGTEYSHRKQKKYREKYPEKIKAHAIVNELLRQGVLAKPKKCLDCRKVVSGRINAHHPDYRLPLYVIWLCTSCHSKKHTEIS